jgi:hypothetical protein
LAIFAQPPQWSLGIIRYTSKIIKAGALLADTKTLLSHWDLSVSVPENLQCLLRENVFGKASRSRIEDMVAIFRQRYLLEEQVTRALVVLVGRRFSAAALDRILYFHAAKVDRLLYDVVTEILIPMQDRGLSSIDTGEVKQVIALWVSEGKTTSRWGDRTILRVTQGVLSTLRDFGVLQGAIHKRIAPAYLPIEAFAYIVFYLKQHQPSGVKLADLSDWKLFFLSREGVERFLLEAHQNQLLEYHAAGTVIRLTFPVHSLEEYAHVLAERAH